MKYVPMLLLLCSISLNTAYTSNSDTANLILYGNNLVYSGVVNYSQEFHNFDTSTGVSVPLKNVTEDIGANQIHSGIRTINMCFYDTKVRIENEYSATNTTFSMNDISTYNNEFSNSLKVYKLPQNENDKVNVSGTIYEENKTAAFFDLRFYTAQIYGSPLEDFVRGIHEYFDLAYTRHAGTEVVNGIECKQYIAVTTDSVYSISAWLAPEYYYRPVKVVLTGDMTREEMVIEYMKDDKTGYMLPRSINVTSYDIVNDNEVIRATQAFDITSFQPNVEIADEAFMIDFPEGMRVYDHRIGKWVEIVKDTENRISYDYSIEELVE